MIFHVIQSQKMNITIVSRIEDTKGVIRIRKSKKNR